MSFYADQTYSTFEGYPSIYHPVDETTGKALISSNIDFCEANFQYSSFIAEPVNTISSYVYLLIAIAHLYFIYKFERTLNKAGRTFWRFYIGSVFCIFLGFGSSFLHATLTRIGQYTDEIPMVMCVNQGIYNYLFKEKKNSDRKWYHNIVVFVLVTFTIGHSLATIWFPKSYSVFVFVFAALLNLSTAFEAIQIYRGNNLADWLCEYLPQSQHAEVEGLVSKIRRIYFIYFSFFLVAFILWAIEFACCPYVYFLHLHAYWHILTAIAANAKSTLWLYLTMLGHGFTDVKLTYFDRFRIVAKIELDEKNKRN
ncbi:hypothetical protein C9374_011805 [Naegleria lovaniensis]|uniref:Uncharacterized protein n=1 Tax=Naegleria lovaniensis TaxID=51637 RepID=A0AA88KF24_NAELO|nr:uncharacterized protein C9374_011805 [Naegleria lovaniensis]KAG2373716.1 hypothetical protein C9374_011805 [Naegleria lovaniensis]